MRNIANTHKQDKSNLLNLNSNEEIPMHKNTTSQTQKQPRNKKRQFFAYFS